jgi:hypothetical protein
MARLGFRPTKVRGMAKSSGIPGKLVEFEFV